MKVDLSNLLNVSTRVSFAVVFACAFILFFPAQYLPFQIDFFREQNGLWIFFIMVIAAAICLSYIVKWGVDKIADFIDKKKLWRTYKVILKNLSVDEKRFIKKHYEKRESAIYIDLSNAMMKRLQSFNVITLGVGTNAGNITRMPGFIQPWVFDLIDKNPHFIETEDKPHD